MKKSVSHVKYVVLLLLIQVQFSLAQTHKTIEINTTLTKKTKDKTKHDSLFWVKFGSVINTKIVGVNSLRLKGFSEVEFKDFDFDIPKVFQTDSVSKTTVTEVGEKSKEKVDLASQKEGIVHHEKFEKDYRTYWTIYSQIHKKSTLVDRLKPLVSEKVIFVPDSLKLKERAKMWYTSLYHDVKHTPKLTEAIKLIHTDFVELERLYTSIFATYTTLSTSLLNNDISLDGTYKGSGNNIEITINKAKIAPLKQATPYDEQFKKLKLTHEKLMSSKTDIEVKSTGGIELLLAICDSDFTVYIDNGMITSDQMTITPFLKDSEGKTVHQFKPRVLRAYGHIKINASAGYLLNFLKDDNYDFVKDTEGNTIGIKRQERNSLDHAAGSLINVYRQSKSDISFGVSAGISIDSDTNVGFYLGGSALAFNKNRMILTAGISYTKKQVLNDSNLTPAMNPDSGALIPNRLDFISPTDTELNYHELYRPSFFIGLTYNFINSN